MNLPYSFAPLFNLLEKLEMTPDDLVKRKILASNTVEKIKSGQQVMLVTASKLCLELGCDFSDILELNYDYDPSDVIDEGSQNYKPWTKEEEEQLIEEYQKGFNISEIAKNMKRAPGAISSRIRRLIFSGMLEQRVKKKNLG